MVEKLDEWVYHYTRSPGSMKGEYQTPLLLATSSTWKVKATADRHILQLSLFTQNVPLWVPLRIYKGTDIF